jgi:large repetitive protein
MYDVVSGVQAAGSLTFQQTITHNVAIGDVIVVCAGSDAGVVVNSVTDSKGHTYTGQVFNFTVNPSGAMLTATAAAAMTSGTDWIKVTYGLTTGNKLVVVKAASGMSSSAADQVNSSTGTSTAPAAGGTGVLSQAHELIIGCIFCASAGGQPFNLSSGGSGKTAHSFGTGYLTMFSNTVNSATATDASGSLPASAAWTCMVITIKYASSGSLAITSTTPPSGTVGTAYTYTMTASGGTGTGYTFNVRDGGPLPPGIQWSPVTMGAAGANTGRICGTTITGLGGAGSAGNYDSHYTFWNSNIYPPANMKVYFSQVAQYPTAASAAAWTSSNPHIGTALDQGRGIILCYRPTVSGTSSDATWPSGGGGAIFPSPSTLSSEYTSLKASVQSVKDACTSVANGAYVAGVIFWQECDNNHNYNPPSSQTPGPITYPEQITYLYFKHYAQFKADFPDVPLIFSLAGFLADKDSSGDPGGLIARFFPGPTPRNPAGWGPGGCYCDAVTVDIYLVGFDAMSATSRRRYCYAEPDLYNAGPPATGTPGYADIADYNNISFGWIEMGNSAGNGTPLDSTVFNGIANTVPLSGPGPGGAGAGVHDTAAHSALATFQKRLDAGRPNIGIAWYEDFSATGLNHISDNSDKRIPWLIQADAACSRVPSGTAKFAGTPTANGSWPLTVQVTDSAGATATAAMTITIGTGTPALTVITGGLLAAANGQAYSQQLAATGGTGTGYTWTINSGSLTGSGISLSSSGLLSGTATNGTGSEVDYTVVFKVTDSGAHTALSATLTLAVQPSGTSGNVQISNTSPLVTGTTGSPYVAHFTFAGGTPPYTVALANDSPPLPAGLVIDNTDPAVDEAGADITDEFGADITSEA